MMDEYIRKKDAIELCNNPLSEQSMRLIPPADVVPVMHGKWEDKEVIHKKCIEEWQSARCSACGKYHTTPYMYYFDDFNFCPNCGADMRGEEG
jgi:hypothetical protein